MKAAKVKQGTINSPFTFHLMVYPFTHLMNQHGLSKEQEVSKQS